MAAKKRIRYRVNVPKPIPSSGWKPAIVWKVSASAAMLVSVNALGARTEVRRIVLKRSTLDEARAAARELDAKGWDHVWIREDER